MELFALAPDMTYHPGGCEQQGNQGPEKGNQ
jgi:hypothetical protein